MRTEVEGMVRLTKQVFVEVIERSEWMDEESKSKSIAQINSMEDVVGAPREYWEDSVVLSVNPFERVSFHAKGGRYKKISEGRNER